MGEPVRGSNQRWPLTSFGESQPHAITRLTKFYVLFHRAPAFGDGLDPIRIAQWFQTERTLRIERAVEETKVHGLRIKGPKTERGKRTISIDDDLVTLLVKAREKLQRIKAGIPDEAAVDLSLVNLPDAALLFPAPPRAGDAFSFAKPGRPRNVTKEFDRKAKALGFDCRFHDLRGSHETALLDKGVPVHVVAARCGHDPAVLLRSYAKRTPKADEKAAAVIGSLLKGVLG